MIEALCIVALVRLPDGVDRAPGAIGQKIEPRRGVLRQQAIPQALRRVGQVARPEFMPCGELDGGEAVLDPFGAAAQFAAVEPQGKAGAAIVKVVEQRQGEGMRDSSKRARHRDCRRTPCATRRCGAPSKSSISLSEMAGEPFILRPVLPVAALPPVVAAVSSSARTRPRWTDSRPAWPMPITAPARAISSGFHCSAPSLSASIRSERVSNSAEMSSGGSSPCPSISAL
jgi:hypothetical protein